MSYRIGFDIGGTFTDVFVYAEESGEVQQAKVLTTPDAFHRGALEGITEALATADVGAEELTHLAHGSTVATNALLEGDGATTGLLTTDGFRDVLAFGRQQRRDLYDISASRQPTFVDRRNRLGVSERISEDGEVLTPLDEADVREAVATLVANGVESIAVSLLHAYRNDEHERRIERLVEAHSELPVSTSSEVMPQIQEYERTLSTVIDAYVGPAVEEYVERLRQELTDLGADVPLHLMLANGGVVTPENLRGRYLKMINSGPAAGVIGAKQVAEASGWNDVVTLDMGGTSTDVSMIRDGTVETTTTGEMDDIPLLFEQVDVRSIGTGGGSIARAEQGTIIKVGPESSGSDPGPACYGRGGTRPTVTDAACVLNYLPDRLGGELELDEVAARDALQRLGDEVGQDATRVAEGILEITATNMVQAIETVTVEKGYDPREFVLACFGGAGPLFCTKIARELGIERALVPVTPGVLSAYGLITSNKRFDFTTSAPMILDEESLADVATLYDDLEAEAWDIGGEDLTVNRSVDLRYHGQSFDVNVAVPDGEITGETLAEIRTAFHERFESIYDFTDETKPIEATTWRLTAADAIEPPTVRPPNPDADPEDAVVRTVEAYADGQFRPHTVYDRYQLPPGASVDGPAIVEEDESTTLVGPGGRFEVDETGNLLVEV